LSRVEDPEQNPTPSSGGVLPSTPFDSLLERRTHESPRQPPEGQVAAGVSAPELEPLNALFGRTGRVAATMGFVAIVALLFVILMPGFRQPDSASSFSADVERFTAALSRQSERRPSGGEAAKPAIAEFQSLLVPPSAPSAQVDHDRSSERSKEFLRQFMQWRQKVNSAGNAQ
jgi:hypothetical protein